MAATMTPASDASHFWQLAPALFQQLNAAGGSLAVSEIVPQEVERSFEALVNALPDTPEALGGANPYLVGALFASAVHGLQALHEEDPHLRRRRLRIPLERARQALRDLLAEEPVMEDRPPKQVAEWLLQHEEIPRVDLARLLAVSPSTLRRWANPTVPAAPRGSEARRLRILARVVNQLRWSYTSAGVVEWLGRPHPMLKGEAPEVLLEDPEGALALLRLASATRAMTLT
jgi:uncharacterized protein (DUF2384 family)